jgi:hypothetical protein
MLKSGMVFIPLCYIFRLLSSEQVGLCKPIIADGKSVINCCGRQYSDDEVALEDVCVYLL